MSVLTIQPMRQDEIPQVVELWNQAITAQGEGYERHWQSVARLEQTVDDPNFLPAGALTAKVDGELVGFGLGYVQTVDFLGTGDIPGLPGRLAGIAVRPDHWRHGIGSRLLEAIEGILGSHGKTELSFAVYHAMPLALIRSIHLDTGPYYFLKSRGYQDLEHDLVFHNDLTSFEIRPWVFERKQRLQEEGFEVRWYKREDRDRVLEFMRRCFSQAWYTIVETAVSAPRLPEIMLVLHDGQPVAFIGPFDTNERRFYFSTDARPGWGGFGSPGVDPEIRQRGIATVLWHLGLDHLRQCGARFTEYGTGLVNPAQHLYFRSGATLIEISCDDMIKILP